MRFKGVKKLHYGLTLMEALIGVAVLSALVTIAIPSYRSFITQKTLKNGTEDLYNFIKTAQSQALSLDRTMYISFRPNGAWCYGLSDAAPCDCTAANSCTVNGVETVMRSTNYAGTAMTMTVNGFSGVSTTPYIQINGIRGDIVIQGSVDLSLAGSSTTVAANAMGLVNICSNQLTSFSSC